LVMLTVCLNTFLMSLLLCEGFSRFCTLHKSFVKTEIESEREQSIWWKNVLLQRGFAPRYLPLYLSNVGINTQSSNLSSLSTALVFKFLTLLSAQLGEVGISLLWASCQCQAQD
jgi:hypothetical protein